MKFFDAYDIIARLLPFFIAIIPFLIWIIFLGYDLSFTKKLTWLVFIVFCYPIMIYVRGEGKKLQDKLFAEWGNPAAVMLRHSDNFLNSDLKIRYHKFLQENITDLKLPSAVKEKKHPEEADKSYENAVQWLISATRNSKNFPLVIAENINYGFRRNLLAIKKQAIFLDIMIILSYLVFLIEEVQTFLGPLPINILEKKYIVAAVLTVIHFIIYAKVVDSRWVHKSAKEYAKQLLSACDTLSKFSKV